jgi:hypothetical protein
LATALQDLDQSQSISMPSISCQRESQWQFGSSLMNYMRPVLYCFDSNSYYIQITASIMRSNFVIFCQITFRGLTGLVDFDQWGHRSSFTLDVMTISDDGLQKVLWKSNNLLLSLMPLMTIKELLMRFSYNSCLLTMTYFNQDNLITH